jgi:hypothetical protein
MHEHGFLLKKEQYNLKNDLMEKVIKSDMLSCILPCFEELNTAC